MLEMTEIHYCKENGDILLKVEDKNFLAHKLILLLSSQFFKDLFEKSSNPSTNENVKFIGTNFPTIEINGESSESIERMLSFVYPDVYVKIAWSNVEDFLRISGKFAINKIRKHCEEFLSQNFQDDIFLTIKLAEDYLLSDVYKESSKLILDDFRNYYTKLDLLSEKTQLKLHKSWMNYEVKLKKYIHKYRNCKVYYNNNNARLEEYISSLKPSLLINTFKELRFEEFYNQCNERFSRNGIKRIVTDYEPLMNNQNDEWYIFIEL